LVWFMSLLGVLVGMVYGLDILYHFATKKFNITL